MSEIQLLQRLSSKLSVLAQGNDPELDLLLGRLRRGLRDPMDLGLLSTLTEDIQRLAFKQNPTPALAAKSEELATEISTLLNTVVVPDKFSSSLKRIASKLSGSPSIEQQVICLREAFGILQSALISATKPSAKSPIPSTSGQPKGLLSWFSNKTTPEESNIAIGNFLSGTLKLLERILTHLELLDEGNPQISAIRDQLSSADSIDDVDKVLEVLIDYLGEISAQITRERISTQSFLSELKTKLHGIEETIFSVVENGDGALDRASLLGSQVNDGVQQIGIVVAKNDDLIALRNSVKTHLSQITARVNNYIEKEREITLEQQKQIRDLSRQVRELETESQNLRVQINTSKNDAIKDPLTGIYNRAGFEDRAQEEFARQARTGSKLSLIFIDCDKFKVINDSHGHSIGDQVLIQNVQAMQKRARTSDIIARFGGDEFVMLLPDTDERGAEKLATDLANFVAKNGIKVKGSRLETTISCGVAQFREGDTLESLLHRADEAMYKAKNFGAGVCVSG